MNKLNNLLELFYRSYQEQDKKNFFLQSIKENRKRYTWEDVYININKLSEEISKDIKKGDRCLLISENRPEWMIADLSIMLSKGITVPTYTTYSERDYEYIIDDCTPSLIIVSNNMQYEKIKNIIPKKNFIKKIIFFDKINIQGNRTYLDINNILEKKNYDIKDFLI